MAPSADGSDGKAAAAAAPPSTETDVVNQVVIDPSVEQEERTGEQQPAQQEKKIDVHSNAVSAAVVAGAKGATSVEQEFAEKDVVAISGDTNATEKDQAVDSGGGWGTTAASWGGLTSALGGWGFGGGDGEGDAAEGTTSNATDTGIEQQTGRVESDEAAAEIEQAAEQAAAAASAAASSLMSSATDYFAGQKTSAFQTLSDFGQQKTSALQTLSDLNPAAWIDDLERESGGKDPHKSLKEHLDAFLEIWPRATYEEWVEELLKYEGWDEGSAVVDDSFYMEDSVHRNLWNERNLEDGIGVQEGGSTEEPKRAYVEARRGSSHGGSSCGGGLDHDDGHEEIVFDSPPQTKEGRKEVTPS